VKLRCGGPWITERDVAGRFCPASLLFLLLSLGFSAVSGFGSPAAWAALEDVSVVQQAVEHSGDGGAVAEQLTPVLNWTIRGQQCAGALVAAHDDLQQFFGGGQWQFAHSEIVDDQQGHGGQQFHVLFASAVQGSVGQIFQQGVRFPIEHAVALQDDGVSDGLGKMTFPASGWAYEKSVLASADEGGGRHDRRRGRGSSWG
jgi:hypothetical protein